MDTLPVEVDALLLAVLPVAAEDQRSEKSMAPDPLDVDVDEGLDCGVRDGDMNEEVVVFDGALVKPPRPLPIMGIVGVGFGAAAGVDPPSMSKRLAPPLLEVAGFSAGMLDVAVRGADALYLTVGTAGAADGADWKSSKSSASPASAPLPEAKVPQSSSSPPEARLGAAAADGVAATAGSSSPKEKRSTSGSFGFAGSALVDVFDRTEGTVTSSSYSSYAALRESSS